MEIRLASAHDSEAIAGIYAPFVRDTAISFEEEPPSADEMAARIRSTLKTHPWLVFDDRDVLGYAYACSHRARGAYRWSTETTVYVRPDAHRRGIGRGLYTSLLRLLELQGFMTALAGITQPNVPSVRLHESVGFVPLGVYRNVGFKLGAWRDVGWWQLQLGDATGPLPRPSSLEQAISLESWNEALQSGLPRIRP